MLTQTYGAKDRISLVGAGAHHTETVSDVVRQTLSDREGVLARAIHVAGQMSLEGLIQIWSDSWKRIVCSFSALYLWFDDRKDAVGNIYRIRRAMLRKHASSAVVKKEPEALAYALGLLRVPAHKTLRDIYRESNDEKVRVAAVWGLSSLRDRRLAAFFEKALLDHSVGVQCAAINALEHLAVPETAPTLMTRFEGLIKCEGEGDDRTCEPIEVLDCPEIALPVQEGGATRIIVKRRE